MIYLLYFIVRSINSNNGGGNKMKMDSDKATLICKALGDLNRMSIVQILTGGERCACELLESLDITQPTLSYHMKILEQCQLVTSRDDWRNTYYSLDCDTWKSFKKFIENISCICDSNENCSNY